MSLIKGRYRPMRIEERRLCADCGHTRYAHKGLGLQVEGEPDRKHVCIAGTRQGCPCREFKSERSESNEQVPTDPAG